ncbi:MAG: 30S ribosomal protein S18 [Candidatus Omnitrophica bacterium ADurb.Bin292]|jgi:small subunit ribosomal protein S18|nr:MAG: 30S ribosomal protein S18 [Candidatus Omnitrophica bacterium ADurb.Bin292]
MERKPAGRFEKKTFKKTAGRPGKPGRYGSSDDRKGPGGSKVFRKRVCRVLPPLNYKDSESLTKYLTEKGKILPRRITRLNAKDQRTLKRLIKRARHAGVLPFQAS